MKSSSSPSPSSPPRTEEGPDGQPWVVPIPWVPDRRSAHPGARSDTWTIFALVALMAVLSFYLVRLVTFERGCYQPLIDAALLSQQPERAVRRLDRALGYLEAHGLTQGRLPSLLPVPVSNGIDVGACYQDLRQARAMLMEPLDERFPERQAQRSFAARLLISDSVRSLWGAILREGVHLAPWTSMFQAMCVLSFGLSAYAVFMGYRASR